MFRSYKILLLSTLFSDEELDDLDSTSVKGNTAWPFGFRLTHREGICNLARMAVTWVGEWTWGTTSRNCSRFDF